MLTPPLVTTASQSAAASPKARVMAALDTLGYDAVDLGPLAEGWRTQRDTAVYVTPYAADAGDPTKGASPASADAVREKVAHAVALLYGLHAIVSLHFAEEEEI